MLHTRSTRSRGRRAAAGLALLTAVATVATPATASVEDGRPTTVRAAVTSVAVSSLTPTYAVNGWGPYERNTSNGSYAAGDGRPMSIRGNGFSTGLGVHASSDLRYSLSGCTRLDAVVGIDDETTGRGTVVFQVFGDATKLYDSGIVGGARAPLAIGIDLTGRTQLRFVVTPGIDGNGYDHADWANALLSCPTPPTTSTSTTSTSTTSTSTTSTSTTSTSTTSTTAPPSPSTVTYPLSAFTPTYAANGWGPYERDTSNGSNAAGDGRPISIRGARYATGLGTHASSQLRFALNGCTRLTAVVGIDDETGGQGTVVFQVLGDATKLYDSGVVNGTRASIPITVDLTGRAQLRLVVTPGTDGNGYDHSDWASTVLTCPTSTPPPIDTTAPLVTLTRPATASVVADTTPMFAGKAGMAIGDTPQVTVQVYSGRSGTGAPAQVAYATPDRNGNWAVDGSTALGAGDYSARADQRDATGNIASSSISWFTVSVPTVAPGDPTLVAVGDIASCASTGDEATAALVDQLPGTIAMLGDAAYDSGTAAEFAQCYEPSWGRFKARTRPTPGNHEYLTPGASGYFDYYGAAAGDPTKGYYSYDIGGWHLVALNTNCSLLIGCNAGSAQELWLKADLAAHPSPCTIAYFHHPLFSSGDEVTPAVGALWQDLANARVDIVLNGHQHAYERFAPQSAAGLLNLTGGVTQFTVGTGGVSEDPFLLAPVANSQVRNFHVYGVLSLTLHARSFDWRFVPVAGQTFTDAGSRSCV